MMLLENPSPWAPLEEWKAWRAELQTLPARDRSVIAAKKLADTIIASMEEEQATEAEPAGPSA